MMAPGRRACILLVSAALLLALVTGCSIPSRPLWWPQPKHGPPVGDGVTMPTVSNPWRPGMRQLGIQVYWAANRYDSDAVVLAKAERIISYAISLHANSVAVTFPFFTHGPTADTVYAKRNVTPTPGHIAIFLAAAAQAHMRVTLRPELSENALIAKNPQAWRGTIQPGNRAAWFRSYHKMLVPYLVTAQAGHAASFVIGTELNSMEGSPQWPGLLRSFRSVYHGQLIYDQNYDAFASGTENPPVQSHDVDAYPQIALPDSASVARVTGAWDAWLGAHPLSVRRQLTLSEVGIQAVAGSYAAPWAWYGTAPAPIDTRVQTAWYHAACNAVSTEQIGGGIYWWEVNFDANPAAPRSFETDRLTFLHRPAEQVIRNCFAKLSARQPGWKVLLHHGINPARQ